MKTITMLEFRKNAGKIIGWARQGQRMVMTYRGKPILRLEPILEESPDENDPFYMLDRLASPKGDNISNEKIDAILYES